MPKSPTFGIGEWYGKSFVKLSTEERIRFAYAALDSPKEMVCLPRTSAADTEIPCSKRGGVCSIRDYGTHHASGPPRITCPHRFAQNNTVFFWIAKEMLGTEDPLILKEVKFLQSFKADPEITKDKDIGNIDNVLVHPDKTPLHWCAVEKQAVYFSGSKMSGEFEHLKTSKEKMPLPVGKRHPDYRSSGPKRLLPQLQTKVRTLRPWGKKLAVIIDEEFFRAMAPMAEVKDLSNAELAWFIVKMKADRKGEFILEPAELRFTTLDSAVDGLTGGHPVTLKQFEERIAKKIARAYPAFSSKLKTLI